MTDCRNCKKLKGKEYTPSKEFRAGAGIYYEYFCDKLGRVALGKLAVFRQLHENCGDFEEK